MSDNREPDALDASERTQDLEHDQSHETTLHVDPTDALEASEVARKDTHQIGRYPAAKILGQGAFGRVYLARDDQLDRDVAIKVPHPYLVSSRDQAAAYLAEAKTVASLEHPNIVPVFDVGSEDDIPFFVVSKYIPGESLKSRIQRSANKISEFAEWIALLAEALHHAHNRGIVHRDVKPGNILITEDGTPYLVDFGLALKDCDLGKGSQYAGTPAYMSPEQARGEGHRVDGRSDIYSLGVILYEFATGRRPFHSESTADLLRLIAANEVKPPRQVNDTIPKELERICLKALANRASDRYTTALDLADDLRHFLLAITDSSGNNAPLPNRESLRIGGRQHESTDLGHKTATQDSIGDLAAVHSHTRIVPKGLRSFDRHDADFFLELLPGPRDRTGLPDSIRFWKTQIEETDPDETFTVGLIYGPSGCGKSSLVKAGLLPRLSEDVVPVYVEATAAETESRILHALSKACPGLDKRLDLSQSMAAIRRGDDGLDSRKLLLVVDQFEQWLHARRGDEETELVRALRQCDATRLQCIVMVRDDFWLAVSRFLRAMEIRRLVEGINIALVDLFDIDHARNVLAGFGRAFGKLPESGEATTSEQQEFLNQAVTGLAEDGKVISVRLALFAEMMKGKSWTTETLAQVGGTKGIGATFLEETFSASTASPEHRYHQRAARKVLKALLPDSGTEIKGQMKSDEDLRQVSGYASGQQDFADLLQVLDGELRLITPTDPEGMEADNKDAVEAAPSPNARYYQLTHDYLVPSLREWLTRKQKETRQGRAELALADRSAVWQARPENRQLPSLLQWFLIRWYTDSKQWTEPQRRMMSRTGRVIGMRTVLFASLFSLIAAVGLLVRNAATSSQNDQLATQGVGSLISAEPTRVADSLSDLEPFRRWAEDDLRREFNQAANASPEKLHAALGLLAYEDSPIDYVRERLLSLSPSEFVYVGVIGEALGDHTDSMVDSLWKVLHNSEQNPALRFRAGLALSHIVGESDQWLESDLTLLVEQLVGTNAVYQPEVWKLLDPLGEPLYSPLELIYTDSSQGEPSLVAAAHALARFAANDPVRLRELLMTGNPAQFEIVLPAFDKVADDASLSQFVELVTQQPTKDLNAEERIALGQRRAKAAIALLRHGEREGIFDVMRWEDEPEAMTQFIHQSHACGVTANEILDCLDIVDSRRGKLDDSRSKDDATVHYALLLALGEFAWDELPSTRETLVERLALIYEQDPSSGVHSACGWLLRRWGQHEAVNRVDQTPLTYDPSGYREWFVKEIEYQSEATAEVLAETKKLYLTFIVYPPAEFTMGSPNIEANHRSDESQHQVTLTRALAVCDRELTWAQWDAFYGPRRRDAYAGQTSKTLSNNDPVFGVSWFDAVTYCRWLTERAGLLEADQCYTDPDMLPKDTEGNPSEWPLVLSGSGFRMPTEAEWEYVCRSDTSSAYSFGNDERYLDRYAWYVEKSENWSHPTGELRPNPRGLFDTHGNLYEWCHDSFNEDELIDETDPIGAETGRFRVNRGGSWSSTAGYCRSSSRRGDDPTTRNVNLGFRLATVPLSDGR